MQNKTIIKSMLLGATLGALTVLSIAAATTQTSPYGRFQLAIGDSWIFKIDTTTGQLWRSPAGNPSAEFMSADIGK
jgi:hypothetical protein